MGVGGVSTLPPIFNEEPSVGHSPHITVTMTRVLTRVCTVCAIPRDSIFSARTASLQVPNAAPAETFADLVLHLTACLLHELRLGQQSRFYGWMQALSQETIMIPTLWGQEDMAGEDGQNAMRWLKGTAVEKELDTKADEGLSLDDLKHYYANTLMALLPSTSTSTSTSDLPSTPTLREFLHAYSLVSSRGFVIDAYHTIGMIPFCDMFNHSSSAPHTALSVDAGVCETCGSLLRCEHDQVADVEDEMPERLADLSQAYLGTLQAEGVADKVDMRAHRDIKAGEQIMSCYDEDKSNAALLVDYGFIDDRSNTRVPWRLGVPDGPGPGLDGTAWPTPIYKAFIRHLYTSGTSFPPTRGFIGPFVNSPPLEPLQIRSDNHLSFPLFLALWLDHYPHAADENPDELVRSLSQAMDEIDQRSRSSSERLSPSTAATVQHIVEALQQRIDSYRNSYMLGYQLSATLHVSISADSSHKMKQVDSI